MEDENKFVEEQENFSDSGSEQSFEEFTTGGNFLKNPAVGSSIEFTLSKIVKQKAKTVVHPQNPKIKFDVKLSKVDYYFDLVTADGSTYTPLAWQVIGKIKAIGRKLGHLQGVDFKISHIADGFKDKTAKEVYKVYAKQADGKYYELTVEGEWVVENGN